MGALFSTFPFNLFFKQILSLKEQKQSVPRLGVGGPSVWSGTSRGTWRGQPSILSRINDWLPQWASWVFAPLLSLFQDIHAARDLAGHLIGKPRVAGLSFAEFQPRAPIWIMYSFRSQGWALNKAYSCLHINFPRMAKRERKKTQNYGAFCSGISTWGLAVGTSEQPAQSPGSLTGAQGRQGERWGVNHKIWKDFPGNWHQCDLFNPDPGSTIWK